MFVERLTLFAFCVDPHTELCRRCFHKLTKGEVVWGVCKISCQTTADLKKQMAQGRNDRLTVGAQGDGPVVRAPEAPRRRRRHRARDSVARRAS